MSQAYERLLAGLHRRAAELSLDTDVLHRREAGYEPRTSIKGEAGDPSSLIPLEKLEAQRQADAAHRERLKQLDHTWHSADRFSLGSGDSVDCAPAWIPGAPKRLLFQSSGLARNAEGYIVAQGPASIQKLDMESGSVTPIFMLAMNF